MEKLHENTDYKPPVGAAIFVGTTGVKIELAFRKLEYTYGIHDQDKQLPAVGIDASGITTTFPVPMIDPQFQHQTLGPNESLSCPLHDAESLEKAEKAGKLWFMPPQWHQQPGVAKDNVGSGGNPRTGNALGALNKNKLTKKFRSMLRYCQDYCNQRQVMQSSEDERITETPVTIIVCASFLGGFGNGNIITILKILRQLERELKLPIRIVLIGIVLGTLEPTDKLIAARNQEMLLRQLDSCIAGQMEDIQSQSPQRQLLCDSLLLLSNANNFGEINNIDKVISHAASIIFYLFHSPLGSQILERCVDIEETWPDDQNGGKLWASTAAITKIHLDAPLIIKCVGYKLMKIFFDRILLDKPIKQASKEAEAVCLEQMLTEEGVKNLASQRLIRPDGNGSSNAIQDTIRIFYDRSGTRRGYQGCCDTANASKYTLGIYMQRNIEPLIAHQADVMTENVIKCINNSTLLDLQRPDGLSFTRQFLETVSQKIINSADANGKKLRNAQAKKKSIDERLSVGHSLLRKLQNRNPLFRFFSFSAKKKCRQILTLQTEQAIKTAVEIKSRVELVNDVYPTILKSITEKLITIQKACENALEMKNEIKMHIQRLENFNALLQVPIGIELADKAMIHNKYLDTLEAEDGEEKIFNNIFSQFQSKFANFLAFNNNRPAGRIQIVLSEYCDSIAQRRLDDLNVMDALEEYAPTSREKSRLMDQAIRESRGSIRTTGEGGRNIPTIKFIGTANYHRAEWLEKMANTIDKTNGDWKSFETGDKNTIILWQQRAQVSVARLINWTTSLWKKPGSIPELSQLGACPISALAPTSCDTDEDIMSIAAMALVTGQINKTDPVEYPFCIDSNTLIDSDIDEIIGKLKNNLSLRTSIYHRFVIDVATSYMQLIAKLDSPQGNCHSIRTDLAEEIENKAFVRAKDIAKALYRHVARLPKETQLYLKNNHPNKEP